MAKKRREQIYYNYECTITGENFTFTVKAPNPSELVSVEGYYSLNSDKDDRPEIEKLRAKAKREAQDKLKADLAAMGPGPNLKS